MKGLRAKRSGTFPAAVACLMLALAAPLPAVAADDPPAGEQTAETASEDKTGHAVSDWLSGTLDMGFEFESSDGDTDFELEQNLRFLVEPPNHDRLRVRGSLWLLEDLDNGEDPTSITRGLRDVDESSLQTRLLYLYLEVDDLWGDSTLRLGRQRIREGVAFNRMDGAYFKKRLTKWDWYTFGGVRASVYESASDEMVAGGGVSARLGLKTRATVDVFYGENKTGGDTFTPIPILDLLGLPQPRRLSFEDDTSSVALTLTHQLTPRHSLFGRYEWNDGDGDEIRLSATGFFSAHEIVYDLSYRRRNSTAGDRANDLTTFYRVLGEFQEFDDIQGTIYIPLHEKLSLALEGQLHNSENDSPTTGNRDYNRWGVILSAYEFLPGVEASAALERWDVNGGEGTWTVTGEVSKEWQRLKMTVGADYEQYQDQVATYFPEFLAAHQALVDAGLAMPNDDPDVFLRDVSFVETHENIHSFYGRAKYAFSDTRAVWMQVLYEEDDGPDSPYWRLQATYSIQF